MKNYLHKIKKLIYWFKIIWKDEDFDYTYFYEIMEHKLKSMQKHFPDNKDIKLALSLLDKMINEYYINEMLSYVEYKLVSYNEKDNMYYKPILEKDNTLEYLKRYNIKNKTDKEAFEIAKQKQDKCKRLFFKLLNDKIETFWD